MAATKKRPKPVTDPAETEEKGYFGLQVDQTPNENYTVAGVLAGKSTPETEALD